MAVISVVCIVVAAAGCVCTLAAALAVRRFGRIGAAQAQAPASSVGVTLLKPLHGAEPGLEDNLRSFLVQDHAGPVQLIFGVADPADESLPVVRRLMQEFAGRDIELVIGGRSAEGNAKIANLAAMNAAIRHEFIVMSDSDIRVQSDYVRRTLDSLRQPGVGLVTCLYRGEPDRGPWALLASMAIDYHFLPSVLLGLWLGLARPCMGATMALTRTTLEAIGGFRSFSNHLADDHAIGEAVRAGGQQVVVAPHVVVHRCVEPSAAQLVQHELRWSRTIRAVDPVGFAASFVNHPLPFALAAAALRGFDAAGAVTLLAALLCRLALQWQVEHTLRVTTWRAALGPVRDLLSFVVFCASFAMSVVVWRGHRYRIRADGTMEELQS